MKSVIVSFILFFISISVFSYDYMLKQQSSAILYANHQEMTIQFHETGNEGSTDFVQALQDFSIENKINISQYNFLDESTLNIYSTNLPKDPNVHLVSGSWPQGVQYVSNRTDEDNKQMGVVSFPVSTWDVRYFDIHEVKNVGLSGRFYLTTQDKDVAERAVQTFSIFGNVSIQNVYYNPLLLINITLLLMVFFALIILCINTVFHTVKNLSQLYLHQLWGYSPWHTFTTILSSFIKPYLFILLTGIIIVIALSFFYSQVHFFLSNILH